jgi:hypothetical protein
MTLRIRMPVSLITQSPKGAVVLKVLKTLVGAVHQMAVAIVEEIVVKKRNRRRRSDQS